MHTLYKLTDQGEPSTHTNAVQGSSSCPWSPKMSEQKATAGMWAQKAIHNPLPMGKRRCHRTDPFPHCVLSLRNVTQAATETTTQWKPIKKPSQNTNLSPAYHEGAGKVSAATRGMALSKILFKFIIKAAGTYSDISEEILADIRSWQTGSGLLPAKVLRFRRKTVPPSSARPVWGLGSPFAAYL